LKLLALLIDQDLVSDCQKQLHVFHKARASQLYAEVVLFSLASLIYWPASKLSVGANASTSIAILSASPDPGWLIAWITAPVLFPDS
jgi:hypothetical protein